jgi:hypothetical protein
MDPRVATPPAALARQLALALRLTSAIHKDYVALAGAGALRRQLASLAKRTTDTASATAKAADTLDASLAALAGERRGRRSPPNGEDLGRVNGDLMTVFNTIESADADPTTQAAAAVPVLEQQAAATLARWHHVQSTDVPALNARLKTEGLPELTLPADTTADH